jgi:ATP-binding cassette, subfamily B, bacterial
MRKRYVEPKADSSVNQSPRQIIARSLEVFRYSGRAIQLVWTTSKGLTLALGISTLIAGLLPGAVAYFGKLIVDGVILAASSRMESDRNLTLSYVFLEALAVITIAATQRGTNVCQNLLRMLLGHRINTLILEKSLTVDLAHFEDSEFYDKMQRARNEASVRPLSLVMRTFGLTQSALTLVTYSALLLRFSPIAVVVLILAAVPAFIAETRFSEQAFRLFNWRSPEARKQNYLEILIAREDFAKEVQLYQLGNMLLERYRGIFGLLYDGDRDLTIKRGFWGYALGLITTFSFYGAYSWIVIEAIGGRITLGEMTMYLIVFRQGQSTFSATLTSIGGIYEDNLYLSNLYDFLEQEIPKAEGTAIQGTIPQAGIQFLNVSFIYPGSSQPVLKEVSFELKHGQKLAIVGENGSGKTTLIKLLTRLYTPTSGKILLDGLDLSEWDIDTLRQRIGVIFQDFVRYQFTVGENVGVGDVEQLMDRDKWEDATEKGKANFIQNLPTGFDTQLGKWFKDGQELSGGQWQKIALSRAFMRSQADILVLDEPTSAMDAEAEASIFEHFRNTTENQMVILISHRFSTVRMADRIIVLANGEITEQGNHQELLEANGRYAHLFSLQAAGYV